MLRVPGQQRMRPFQFLTFVFIVFGPITWGQTSPAQKLTQVQEIRTLTAEQAKCKITVRVRGTVTTPSGYTDSFFLQDATAGISVDQSAGKTSVRAGDFIEVEAVTQPGLFAPSLASHRIHILHKSPFPKAQIFRLDQLMGGTQDSQWIAIRGVVRAAEVKKTRDRQVLFLTIDTGERLTSARVLNYSGDYQHLIDAEVLIRGVCGTVFNGHRQFVGVRMFVPSLREIKVEKPGKDDPFDCPLRPLNGLLQFGRDVPPYHRIRVRGTVTYQRPGKEIYLEQENLALLVHASTPNRVPLGTVIEAAGFAGQGTYSPELNDVVFRIIGKGPLPAPLITRASKIIEVRNFSIYLPYDGQLVQLPGQVVGVSEAHDEHTILLNDAGTVFPVILHKESAQELAKVVPGSVMQVTGICAAETNKNGEPEAFQILARSPDDLRLLASPSWWNPRHTLTVLAVTVLLTLAAFSFIYLQRRRITRQGQALSSSARILQRALDNVPLLTLSLDRDGCITGCNGLLLKLLGRPVQEVIGLNWQKHFVAEVCPVLDKPLVDASFSDQLRVMHQDYIRSGDGSLRLVSWFNAVVHDVNGNGIGTIALGEDISERKRAEETLSNAVAAAKAANKAKSEFLASMSHEIRTPMNGILGMTGLVLQSELSADQRENLDMVKSSAEALLTIINEILDFSKIEAGKLVLETIPFCLEDTVSKAVASLELQARNKGLKLSYHLDSQSSQFFMGDPGRLRQILLNLMGNALKFTKQGEVTLQVETEHLAEGGAELHFRVKDTGIGIPAEQQQKIFEAFSQADASITRQFGGTGLGLNISARLVHLFGGKIWVESEPEVGSTFHFTAKFALTAAPTSATVAVDIKNLPVLLVGDNTTSRSALEQVLASLGLVVTVAESREGTLGMLEQAAAGGHPYPLVILDLDMQMQDTDRFGIAKRIRDITDLSHTKLILLTSHGLRGDSARCTELDVSGYLQKPIKRDDLQRAISEVIGSSAAGQKVPHLVTRHSLRESRRHVLLAEDNVVNQRLAVKLIEKQGHTVVIAHNGQEAIDALKRETFDVVLMDLQMPIMGGIEATAKIRSNEKETGGRIKIYALTADAMTGDREKCLEADMDGYLSKPLKVEELYAALV